VISANAIVHDGDDGKEHCPRCGAVLGEHLAAHDDHEDYEEEGAPKPPWHFKLLLVATVIYLIYRLIWFIFWLSHHA
jgi:hypothetical protein